MAIIIEGAKYKMVKFEKWEDLNSIEVIYKLIQKNMGEIGEDFIDQNESIVREIPFASYLLGKGYITKDILNSLIDEKGTLQELLGSHDKFSIFPNGAQENESNYKGYHLLAEYIFQVDVLKYRLFNILKNWGYNAEDKKENEAEYGITEVILDDEDFRASNIKFGSLQDEWLWVSNHSVDEVNRILYRRKIMNEKEIN